MLSEELATAINQGWARSLQSKLFRHGFVSMKDMKAKPQNHHLSQPLPNVRLSWHTGEASAQQDNVTSHGPVWPTCLNFSRSCWPFC